MVSSSLLSAKKLPVDNYNLKNNFSDSNKIYNDNNIDSNYISNVSNDEKIDNNSNNATNINDDKQINFNYNYKLNNTLNNNLIDNDVRNENRKEISNINIIKKNGIKINKIINTTEELSNKLENLMKSFYKIENSLDFDPKLVRLV